MGKTTAFRKWVRATQACLVCGASRPDPHHVEAKGMGGVADEEAVDVENVVPLCQTHHTEGHRVGWATFSFRYGLNLKREAERLWARWESWDRGLAW